MQAPLRHMLQQAYRKRKPKLMSRFQRWRPAETRAFRRLRSKVKSNLVLLVAHAVEHQMSRSSMPRDRTLLRLPPVRAKGADPAADPAAGSLQSKPAFQLHMPVSATKQVVELTLV